MDQWHFSSAEWILGTCAVAVSCVCRDTSVYYLECVCVSCMSANICVYTLYVVHVLCACILCVVCMSSALCMCQYFRTCNRDPPVISPTCQPTHQPSWRPFLKTWNLKQIIQNAQPNDGAESWLRGAPIFYRTNVQFVKVDMLVLCCWNLDNIFNYCPLVSHKF